MKTKSIASIVFCAALAGGCVGGEIDVAETTPDLAYVGPGVSVIANYDEPIFFADGYYWWFYGGYWYRSTYYTGGWSYVAMPPQTIVSIRAPLFYRHYRPAYYHARVRPVPAHRVQRPIVRDHRR